PKCDEPEQKRQQRWQEKDHQQCERQVGERRKPSRYAGETAAVHEVGERFSRHTVEVLVSSFLKGEVIGHQVATNPEIQSLAEAEEPGEAPDKVHAQCKERQGKPAAEE